MASANRIPPANSEPIPRLPLFAPLFEHPIAMRDLISNYVFRDTPEAIRQLDFDNMVRVPDDWVPVGPRFADCVWSIPLLHRPEPCWPTHVLFLLRFEARVVQDMKAHLDRHSASLLREINRRAAFGAPAAPPPITPVVIYHGEQPWNADGALPC